MIIKCELFTVAQDDRVEALRTTVPEWLGNLEGEQILIVGLPKVLGKWDEAVPLAMPAGSEQMFLEWLESNKEDVRGLTYNLPKLTAGFQLVVIEPPYDEVLVPDGAQNPLRGTMEAFQKWYAAQQMANAG